MIFQCETPLFPVEKERKKQTTQGRDGQKERKKTDSPREGWAKKERKHTTQGRDGQSCAREGGKIL